MGKLLLWLVPKVGLGWARGIIYGVLVAIIVGAVMYCYHWAAENGRNEVRVEWNKEHEAINKAAADKRLENAIKKQEGVERTKAIELEHKQALTRLGLSELDRTKLQQQLRAMQNETKHLETRLNDTNANWNQRVQLDTKRNQLGMPEEPEADCDTAHTGRDCDASINRTLIDACKITTVDLVSCLDSLDNDTATVGREQ